MTRLSIGPSRSCAASCSVTSSATADLGKPCQIQMRLRDYFPDPERMTGRTTRMLARVAVAIERGEQVAVVVFGPERASIADMLARKGYYPARVMIVSLDYLYTLQG